MFNCIKNILKDVRLKVIIEIIINCFAPRTQTNIIKDLFKSVYSKHLIPSLDDCLFIMFVPYVMRLAPLFTYRLAVFTDCIISLLVVSVTMIVKAFVD